MDDTNTEPENSPAPATPPPKLLDQLVAMQTHAGQELPPDAPRQKSKAGILPWILVILLAGALAFVLFGGQLKKPAAAEAEQAVQAPSPTPAVSLKPRVSVPVPTDTEVDVTPVPPAGGDLLVELDRKLTAEISAGEGGLKPLIGKASLTLLDSKHGLTDDDLKGQNPDAKVLASTYQDMFRRLGANLGKSGNVLADVELLAAETDRLAASSEGRRDLQIAKAVLCQRVNGFGRYEAFSSNEFTQGAIPLILVYSELVDFKTRNENNGQFVVKLKEELSVETASGDAKEVWKEREVSVTDAASSRRHDFFIAQYLNLPKTIEPGTYNLRIKITDDASSQTAVAVVPVTIKAK